MGIIQYQVDAFTAKHFRGNPAAVCILKAWISEDQMQDIAQENNLSETAFVVAEKDGFAIRWFTPQTEVALCGHATLASAHVLFEHLNYPKEKILFYSRQRGILEVRKLDNSMLELNFPAENASPLNIPKGIVKALGKAPKACFKGRTDYMLVYETEEEIENIVPDFTALGNVEARGIIITAPGKEVDFVSRFFAPGSGIDEDPVTGSAHCLLTPYWTKALGLKQMEAHQLSSRGGALKVSLEGERVKIAGHAISFLQAELFITPNYT